MPIVTLSTGARFECATHESILTAALRAGQPMAYSCRNGRCGSCKCKVAQGHSALLHPESGLDDAERAQGWILSCARSPAQDLSLEVEAWDGYELPAALTLPCRIDALQPLAPTVMQVTLRLPPQARLIYHPGQYVDVIGAQGLRRSYSLACAQASDQRLRLHVRRVAEGAMSRYWFEQAQVGDLLRLQGPLGTYFLRQIGSLDLVFLATGTGIAPVLAMLQGLALRAAPERPRSVTVYWGARGASDLYCDVGGAGARFVPVLSRPDAGWQGERGHVQTAMLRLQPPGPQTLVYASGSQAMVRGARTALLAAGLPATRFFADAFVCSATA